MDSDAPTAREKIFKELVLIDDTAPRPAALQMAVDEVLLGLSDLPVLRFYRWESPCVTIGYFESYAAATAEHPGLPVVRRWTGGGKVLHGEDTPYSLIVPGCEPFAAIRPAVAYRVIHSALAEALRRWFPEITLAIENAPKRSAACFENPVAADLLCGEQKVGGAGQRRTRLGLLHQGSLRVKSNPFQDTRIFAENLAIRVRSSAMFSEVLPLAERLTETRYGLSDWNQDRRRR